MSFADYILYDGNDSLVISDGTLRVEDLSLAVADILNAYYIFSHADISDTLKEFYSTNLDYASSDFLYDLYEDMVYELEDILTEEGMFLTTAEGDPACLMICRSNSFNDEEDY